MTLPSLARATALFTFANIVPKMGALVLMPMYIVVVCLSE